MTPPVQPSTSAPSPIGRTLFGLSIPAASLVGVNFFMADVRDGLVGMLATIPAGALVDATHFKRA